MILIQQFLCTHNNYDIIINTTIQMIQYFKSCLHRINKNKLGQIKISFQLLYFILQKVYEEKEQREQYSNIPHFLLALPSLVAL